MVCDIYLFICIVDVLVVGDQVMRVGVNVELIELEGLELLLNEDDDDDDVDDVDYGDEELVINYLVFVQFDKVSRNGCMCDWWSKRILNN